MRNIVLTEDSALPAPAIRGRSLQADLDRVREILADLGRLRSLRDPLATMCERMDLSPAQLHCIAWLGIDRALTMGEVSRRLGITEKTMTGIADRLQTSGHVTRERDLADRRVVRLRLTSAGQGVYERIDEGVTVNLRSLLVLLDATDRHTFSRILEKLRDKLIKRSKAAVREGT